MSTARVVPSWITAVKAEPGSCQPTKAGTMRRWPVLEMGRNSVSPCTIPRTIASKSDMSAAPYRGHPELILALRLLAALAGGLDLVERVLARVPAVDRHLLLLEVLVDREEVGDLVAQRARYVVERLERVPGGIGQGDAQDLVVDPLVVLHTEQRDRLDLDQAAGERGLGHEHHRVERVGVLAERVRDEAVVGRVDHRGEEEAVELDRVPVVVVLVLVAASLRDLDDADQRFVGHRAALSPSGPRGNILGRCAAASPSPFSPRSRSRWRAPRRRSRLTRARAGPAS